MMESIELLERMARKGPKRQRLLAADKLEQLGVISGVNAGVGTSRSESSLFDSILVKERVEKVSSDC